MGRSAGERALRARALPPAEARRRAGRRAEARRVTRSEESKLTGGTGIIRREVIERGGSSEAKNLSLLEAKELSAAI